MYICIFYLRYPSYPAIFKVARISRLIVTPVEGRERIADRHEDARAEALCEAYVAKAACKFSNDRTRTRTGDKDRRLDAHKVVTHPISRFVAPYAKCRSHFLRFDVRESIRAPQGLSGALPEIKTARRVRDSRRSFRRNYVSVIGSLSMTVSQLDVNPFVNTPPE